VESLDQFLARPRGLVIDGAERPAATGEKLGAAIIADYPRS
jgi:hypothetical protein